MYTSVDVHDYFYMWQNIKYTVNITHTKHLTKAQEKHFSLIGSARP